MNDDTSTRELRAPRNRRERRSLARAAKRKGVPLADAVFLHEREDLSAIRKASPGTVRTHNKPTLHQS